MSHTKAAWQYSAAGLNALATAQFIVRAVNAFEPMREALQGLLARHRDGSDESHWAEWDAAEQALALVEKEKP